MTGQPKQSDEHTQRESIILLISLLSLIATVIGSLYAYFNVREARRIAQSSGALKVPEVTLKYGLLPLHQKDANTQTVVYGMPQDFQRKFIGMLPILVENTGKRAAENVKLEVVVPCGANSGAEVLKFHTTRGLLPGFSRECFRIRDLLHIYYHIPIINPGTVISIEEPFWLEKTVDARVSSSIPTADKKTVQFEAVFSFCFNFRLILDHKEEPPIVANIKLYVIEENEIEKLAQRWVKMEAEASGDFPKEGSDKEQFYWLIKHFEQKKLLLAEQKKFLLVLPTFDEIKLPRKKSISFEDINKSQRWELTRTEGKWGLRKCEWIFS